MTVQSLVTEVTGAGNGAATSFPATGLTIFDETQVDVFIKLDGETEATEVTLGTGATNFSVTATFPGTRAITFSVVYPADTVTPLSTGDTVYIRRGMPLTQLTALSAQGGYNPQTQESAFDTNAMSIQQLQGDMDRAVKIAVGDSTTDPDTAIATIVAAAASTAADVVLTNADVVSTNADVVLTNADVVSTGLDAATTASAVSAVAPKWTFASSTAMADPGAGNFRLDNATIGSAANIAFDATSADTGNPDLSDYLVTWDDSSSTINGTLVMRKGGAPATFAIFNVTGTVVDNTGWLQVPVTYVDGNGTFTAADEIYFTFLRTGDAGSAFSASDISGQTEAVIAAGDSIVWTDADDSGNLKKDTVQGILDLVPASGAGFKHKVSAYVSSAQNATTSWSKVVFGTELWDADSEWDTTNSIFEPDSNGRYEVLCSIQVNSIADQKDVALQITKNGAPGTGTTLATFSAAGVSAATSDAVALQFSKAFDLVTTDDVALYVLHSDTGNKAIDINGWASYIEIKEVVS